jgi:hypothetical protein
MWGVIAFGVMLLVLSPMFIKQWRVHRAHGSRMSDGFFARDAIIELDLDEPHQVALCKRALLEVAGTRTTRKPKRHKLNVLTHLPGEMAGGAAVNFHFEPKRVRVVLFAKYGELNYEINQKRNDLLQRLAAYIAEHGNGQVVGSGRGVFTGA